MKNLFQPLLLLIAGATQKELARQVRYLKVENEILRSKLPARVTVTEKEKNRLAKFAAKLGSAINELVSIVHPETLRRWIRALNQTVKKKVVKRGRPKTDAELREQILKVARENEWGYTRILGEIRKLGFKGISRQTVRNILKEEGIEPAPDRTSDKWNQFLDRHKNTLWACDFFSVKAVTARGIQNLCCLVFLCVETREVIVSSSTQHPNSAWVKGQTGAFIEQSADQTEMPSIVMNDRDRKLTKEFVAVLKENGIRTNALPVAPPNLNGRVERFIQSIKREGLGKFILFSRRHLDHIATDRVEYYDT